MNQELLKFPVELHGDITSIRNNGGVLTADRCKKVCEHLNISIECLMTKLLPIAANYSLSSISSYRVGAVARGVEKYSDGMADLYLAANLEVAQQALCHTLHAEQAAISNAWLHGESVVTALAVSAAPCGHCRQFLYEVVGDNPLPILLANNTAVGMTVLTTTEEDEYEVTDLSDLLPAAFGPLDLGCEQLLMDKEFVSNKLKLTDASADELVNLALNAANLSYAPYSGNFAGCVLKLTNGKTVVGRSAENAAFNPSLIAISAAFSQLALTGLTAQQQNIERAILVENPTKSCQKQLTMMLLTSYGEDITFEYFEAAIG